MNIIFIMYRKYQKKYAQCIVLKLENYHTENLLRTEKKKNVYLIQTKLH